MSCTSAKQALGISAASVVSTQRMADRAKKTRELLARHAYELYERRGRADGYAAEDWVQAERELLFPVPTDFAETNDALKVRVTVPDPSVSGLEICVEPRRLTIAGRVSSESTGRRNVGKGPQIFQVIDLPTKVDASDASASLKDGVLEIEIPKRMD